MKHTQIVKGGHYSDGKGNIRLIIDEGPQYARFTGQREMDCVKWRQVERGKRGEPVGKEGTMTRRSMAAWAVERAYALTQD